jgi:hypothetical protein
MGRSGEGCGVKRLLALAAAATLLAAPAAAILGQPPPGGAGRGGPPRSGQAGAAADLTGYWVSVVTEDWRYRMVTPPKGEYGGVGMSPAGRKIADAWDPAKDEAAGDQCKAYGAAGVMRLPGFLRITWENENTLRIDTSAGTQTRHIFFGAPPPPAGEPSWQGYSVGEWETAAATPGRPRTGNLKVVTTRMKAGYLRKNGVPYSANAVLTEWYDRITTPDRDTWLNVTTEVSDREYLNGVFVTTSHFKKLPDGSRFKPEPCSAR